MSGPINSDRLDVLNGNANFRAKKIFRYRSRVGELLRLNWQAGIAGKLKVFF
jgi:hypothetical protein